VVYIVATEYIQIEFPNISVEQAEIFIALLSRSGFEGFEEDANNLKAFIRASDFDETILVGIIHQFNIPFSKSVIKETNWNQLWESNFQPVVIEDLILNKPWVAIRADFHDPIEGVRHEIVITPKMSFGTGHHATTCMMIQQMSEIDFMGKTVFDFGTGTGILSILAEKLGAGEIIAIDNDEWSIKNAAENLQLNNCHTIQLKKTDAAPITQFDIILANINKNVILDHFSSLINQLNPKGALLVSGLLTDDEKDIVKKADKFSMQRDKVIENNNWICIRFNH
jgi:ribosomal protein L11 methyltransferase